MRNDTVDAAWGWVCREQTQHAQADHDCNTNCVGEADATSGDAGGSNSRFGGMAARASHWGASDAAGLYLALGDEAEVPAPLVGSDALVAPRPATARSVTRQRAVGYSTTGTVLLGRVNLYFLELAWIVTGVR